MSKTEKPEDGGFYEFVFAAVILVLGGTLVASVAIGCIAFVRWLWGVTFA